MGTEQATVTHARESHPRQDHLRGFLADHDGGGVGVAGGEGGHDRGVGDPQALHPVDPEPVIDHGHRVGAHLAGAAP